MNETLVDDLGNVVKRLEIFNQAIFSACENSEQLSYPNILHRIFAEGRLYGEYIHNRTLTVVKAILYVSEWLVATGDIKFYSFPSERSLVCKEAIGLIAPLQTNYDKILLRLADIQREIEIEEKRLEKGISQGKGDGIDVSTTEPRGQRVSQDVIGEKRKVGFRENLKSSFRKPPKTHNSETIVQIVSHAVTERVDDDAKNQSKPRIKSTIPFRRGRNDKAAGSQHQDLQIVKSTLQTLVSAINSLSKFLNSANSTLRAINDPRKLPPSKIDQISDRVAIIKMGEITIERCKKIFLARLDQYITFFGVDAKVDETYRKNWRSQMNI